MPKARVASSAGRSRRQPGHRGLDAGDRAAHGHRLGRGIHTRPRGAAARLVPRAARSRSIRGAMAAPAPRPRAGPGGRQNAAPDAAISLIRGRSCSSTARCSAWFWPFAREEPHGHPPFYALLGLVGDVLAPSWQDLPRARLGPILLFSLTAGAIYCFVASRWGDWPAALAAGTWVLQPNLFGHGHYAAYDAVLTSLWVLSIIAFAQAVIPDDESGSPTAVDAMGLGRDLRPGSRLRGGDQVHRLVPAAAVSGLVVSLSQPARVQDTRSWAA